MMSSSSSKQNIIVINSSHYLPTGSGNKFVYKFQPSFNFSSNDKIGVQSLSIFNSFFNISEKYGNNNLTFTFPCHNPEVGSSATFQGYIGNSVQFQGQIINPVNVEISGSTIPQTSSFTGFVGGDKTNFNGYITTRNMLRITTGTPALNNQMYINGTGTKIVSGNNASGWTLSDTGLNPTGSLQAPISMFATGPGTKLYITNTLSAAVPATGSASSGSIYVTASGFTSQTITNTYISQITSQICDLTNQTATYISSRQFIAGVGTTTFTGTSDGTVYPGMQFVHNGQTFTISNPSVSGTALTFSLDARAGIFPGSSIHNFAIPSNAFSILTVSGTPVGNGIFLLGSTMILTGTGVNSNIQVLDQLSSTGALTGVAGVYKISYNPNTIVQTMYANNNVTNNTQLYVSSVSSGAIVPGMQFKISGTYITINSQISNGVFSISTPSGIIPSIYPQQISASMSFSNSITLNIKIPDGFYDASSLNYFLQNVCIANNCYLTDSTGSGYNTYFLEVLQNSVYYGFQINVYPLPKILPSTLAYPPGATWTLLNDSNTYTPTISFGAGLQKYFGFSSNIVNKTSGQIAIDENGFMSIPASTTALQNAQTSLYLNNSVAAKTYTFISDVCPNITTVNSLVVDCNLINSKYNSERSQIFYSVPLSARFVW